MALKTVTIRVGASERSGNSSAARPALRSSAVDIPPFDAARKASAPLASAEPLPSEAITSEEQSPTPLPRRSFWQRFGRLISAVLAAVLIGGAAVGLWYGLPIKAVQITGNSHLSAAQVKQLAGLSGEKPFGWLYYGLWRATGLRDEPWVASAQLTRIFPDRVEISVAERTPVAQVRDRSGQVSVIAADGTPLPGAVATGPVISGWGPDRTQDALFAVRAFSRYNVESVTYTPTGITVQTGKGTIWSGDIKLLLKYGQAIETQAPVGRINLYPWGVSVQR
ncbi:cell division protein FtsQ/DivIB [Deinococcus detaillensis]|uniref:cell division protein FtsQ/DivIB n=1 Tax=Deinococcus detaillensis TaxID=2592048 RepID=UPI001CDC0009|nr:FtsQ-type POTRA domain-containing protein [Deinococcus detaillensis]